MADPEEILSQEPVSPSGEVVSPDSAEIEVSGPPATPEEDNDIAALDAAIEAAPTPEAKKSAQDKRNSAWAQNRRERQAAKEGRRKPVKRRHSTVDKQMLYKRFLPPPRLSPPPSSQR